MKRRLDPTRLRGATAVALLLVASFVGRLHEALVPHRICAEHGESIEVARAGSPPQQAPSGPKVVGSSKSRESLHEHCDLVLLGRAKQVLVLPWMPTGLALSEQEREWIASTGSPEASVPLLLLAPKHSPPAIG